MEHHRAIRLMNRADLAARNSIADLTTKFFVHAVHVVDTFRKRVIALEIVADLKIVGLVKRLHPFLSGELRRNAKVAANLVQRVASKTQMNGLGNRIRRGQLATGLIEILAGGFLFEVHDQKM